MSKIVRAVVIAALAAAPVFGAVATASAAAPGAGIGWDQASTSVAAAGISATSVVTPPPNGIGWD